MNSVVRQADDTEKTKSSSKNNPVEIAREWLDNARRAMLLVLLAFLLWRWTFVEERLGELVFGAKTLVEILKDYKDAFEAAGIVVAAIWTWLIFIRKRERYPRAEVSQTVSFWPIPGMRRYVRVSLAMKNIGEVLIQTKGGCTRILNLKPWEEDILTEESKGIQIPWRWHCDKEFDKPFDIEPGETAHILVECIIPDWCEIGLVYSHVDNLRKRRNFGWPIETVVDFTAPLITTNTEIMSNGHGAPDKKQTEVRPQTRPSERPERKIQTERRPPTQPAQPPKKQN